MVCLCWPNGSLFKKFTLYKHCKILDHYFLDIWTFLNHLSALKSYFGIRQKLVLSINRVIAI